METRSILIMNWRDIRNPEAGGAEVYTHEVAKRWVEWGHEVMLLTSSFSQAAYEETLDGVQIVRKGDRFTVYRHVRRTFSERFRQWPEAVIDEINTRPFFAPRYVDHGTPVFALIFQLAREFWSYETPFPLSLLGRYWLEDHWLRQYREVPTFTISKSTESDLVSLGFREVTVVPAGVSVPPLDGLPEKNEAPTLVYLGRFKRAKLPDHALKAFDLVRSQLPAARLWMVGDGYLRSQLERRAPPGVTFFGRVSEPQKLELLRRAHVLLSPGVREGWGLTVLEANAVGTPAVGYDVPGLRDSIIQGETGICVPFGSHEALAWAALGLLQNPSARARLGENALRWARQFEWDRTARTLLSHLAGY